MSFKKRVSARMEPDAKNSSSTYAVLFNSTVVLTGLTWTAYLVGVVFHETFLSSMGFTAELYPKQAADYFVYAFIACFSSVTAALPFMLEDFVVVGVILATCAFTVLMALTVNALERSRWVRAVRSKVAQKPGLKSASNLVAMPVLISFLIFYTPILLGFILVVPVVIGQSAGEREARRYMNRSDAGCEIQTKMEWRCATLMQAGKPIATGIVVDATEKHVAILEKERSQSFMLEGRDLITLRASTKPR